MAKHPQGNEDALRRLREATEDDVESAVGGLELPAPRSIASPLSEPARQKSGGGPAPEGFEVEEVEATSSSEDNMRELLEEVRDGFRRILQIMGGD